MRGRLLSEHHVFDRSTRGIGFRRVLRARFRDRRLILALAAGALVLVLALVVIRVASAPVDAGWLKPMVENLLASQVGGGRAKIDKAELVWFGPAKSLGLELSGVRLTDGRGRDVIRAKQLDAGLALDALFGFNLAVGRVTAHDFFAAVSVSPRGKYALGYDAAGKPPGGQSELMGLLADLTGKERFGHPASFLRQVDLENGRLSLHQIGGLASWTADVRTLKFEKLDGKLNTRADVTIDDVRPAEKAVLNVMGRASVGLHDALLSARIDGLVPALVFPSTGATAPLSMLDAVVNGRGSISYDFKAGVRAADLSLNAGKGILRVGRNAQAFESAQAVAGYDPKAGVIELRTLKVAAQTTQLDLTGRFRLVPEDAKNQLPARVDFAVAGPRVLATLAADATPQELTQVSVAGRYTPELKRLDLQQASALLGATQIAARAVFTGDDRSRWGVKLNARVNGAVTPAQVMAFWPMKVAGPVRVWLHGALLGGELSNAAFLIDADPGEFSKPRLTNDDLKITFDFKDTSLRFAPQMTPITAGFGRGVVQGNRFDLSLSSARMETVALSEGTIEIAAFKPDGGIGKFKGRASGDAREIMTVLDRQPLNLFTHNGFSPSRVSGQADVRFEIDRPMLFDVPAKDYRVHFGGVIHRAGLTQAALGWDLTGGELKIDGDQDKVSLIGTGVTGPYRGNIDFGMRYQGGGDHAMTVDVNGAIQASILGGRAGLATPFAGKFRVAGGAGLGTIHSPVFDGRVNWKDGNGPDRMVLDGWGSAPALRRIGAPFVIGAPDRFPTQLRLARAGDVWKGPFRADVLAATVTFMPGAQRTRLVVQSDVTPMEARRMGLGTLPLFTQARPVVVDASWVGGVGAAQVRAGAVNLNLAWNNDAAGSGERRVKADLTGADLASLGLPVALARPGASLPVAATWKDTPDGMAGAADVDGVPIKFTSGSGKGGATVFSAHADLDRSAMRRLGVPATLDVDGTASLTARWASVDRASAGRVDIDLGRTALGVSRTDWRKPAGQAARLSVDFVETGDGAIRLTHISGEGPTMDLDGSGVINAAGRLTSLDLGRARLNGLIDSRVIMTRDAQGMNLTLRGKWLDVRRIVGDLTQPDEAGSGGGGDTAPFRVQADLDGLRFSDGAPLRNTSIKGVWGAPAVRRLDVSAVMTGGAKVWGRLYPVAGGTAILAQTADAGQAAKTLFDLQTLRGGSAVLSGKLVDGGADLMLEMKNVRLIKAPTMAQILTLASLRGLADTLNGEGVLFSNVVAPVKIRGHKLYVGDARATGSALGLTTKGVADMSSDTLDFQGTIAPAYGINSAVGHVPVLGQLLTSRKGEGVVGLGYWAKGSFEKPQVSVNPLSLVTPGILRRMFETPAKSGEAPAAKPRRTSARAPAPRAP
jgi:hypothetical protein